MNREPSCAEVIYERYYEMLYVPFTNPYSKPPVCMYSSYHTHRAVVKPSIAGVYLTRYSDILHPFRGLSQDHIQSFLAN